jgi:hypothetical protein
MQSEVRDSYGPSGTGSYGPSGTGSCLWRHYKLSELREQREKTYRTDPMLNSWGRVALRLPLWISNSAQLKLLGIQCNVILDPKMCMWNFLQAVRTNEPMPEYFSNSRCVACEVVWRSLFEKSTVNPDERASCEDGDVIWIFELKIPQGPN